MLGKLFQFHSIFMWCNGDSCQIRKVVSLAKKYTHREGGGVYVGQGYMSNWQIYRLQVPSRHIYDLQLFRLILVIFSEQTCTCFICVRLNYNQVTLAFEGNIPRWSLPSQVFLYRHTFQFSFCFLDDIYKPFYDYLSPCKLYDTSDTLLSLKMLRIHPFHVLLFLCLWISESGYEDTKIWMFST